MKSIKKLLLLLVVILLSLLSVNATTTLTSCGKNSGWVTGETYLINLTNPNIYDTIIGGDTCFLIPQSENVNGITFEQINDKLYFKNTRLFQIQYYPNALGFTFNNLDLVYNQNYTSGFNGAFIYYNSLGQATYSCGGGATYTMNYNFNNLNIVQENITNIAELIYQGVHAEGRDCGGTCAGYYTEGTTLNNIFYTNSFIKTQSTPIFRIGGTGGGEGYPCNSYRSGVGYMNYNATNSIFIAENNKVNDYYNSGFGYSYTYPHYINSFTKIGVYPETNTNYGLAYYSLNSLGTYYTSVDTNYNNIDDANSDPNIVNQKIAVDVLGFTFFQDAEFGNAQFSSNKNIVAMGSNTLGVYTYPLNVFTNSNLSTELGYALFNNMFGISLPLNSKIQSMFGKKMYMQDDTSILNSALNFKPLISITGNNVEIQDVYFNKVHANNNGHIIANGISGTLNGINIHNNKFRKSDTNFKGSNNYVLKFLGTSTTINNNTFILDTLNSGGYEILSLVGNKNSNKIYYNTFTTDVTGTPNEIFTNENNALFYNNYVGSNIVLSLNSSIDVNPTPLLAFNHSDGKIYYFRVGNYYEANVGCVDADADGFCDSSYTSGNIVDTHPLSNYPFKYNLHLLTAESVVDNLVFDITLSEPNDLQVFNIATTSTPIQFGFSENSDFTDLNCYYIIDGSNAYTLLNVSKNVVYNQSFNGWTNGTHTYRVECGNEFQYILSNEITFTTNIGGTGGTGGNGNNTGEGSTDYSTGGINLIDANSISNTADNVDGFIGDFTNGLTNLIVPVAVFIIFFMVVIIVMKFLGA
jgi:hypothetical protein